MAQLAQRGKGGRAVTTSQSRGDTERFSYQRTTAAESM